MPLPILLRPMRLLQEVTQLRVHPLGGAGEAVLVEELEVGVEVAERPHRLQSQPP